MKNRNLSREELGDFIDLVPGVFYQYHLDNDGNSHYPFISNLSKLGIPLPPKGVDPLFYFMERLEVKDPDAFIKSIQESAKNLTKWTAEYHYIHPDKGSTWLESVAIPTRQADGSILWNGHLRDSTEEKIKELFLQDALISKDSFISIVSHELKTPLTVMLLRLEMLLRKTQEDDTVKEVKTIIEQCKKMSQQINNLVDSGPLSKNKSLYENEKYDVHELVKDYVKSIESALTKNKVSVKIHNQNMVMTRFSKDRLGQILGNIILNVPKFAPNSELNIFIKGDGIVNTVEIEDNGPGISLDILPSIFERFKRFENKFSIAGMGLGLYVTRKLLQEIGGGITVKSEEGKGTSFHVHFPSDQD